MRPIALYPRSPLLLDLLSAHLEQLTACENEQEALQKLHDKAVIAALIDEDHVLTVHTLDYTESLSKPFRLDHLFTLCQVNVITPTTEHIAMGAYSFDPLSRTLTGPRKLHLREKESELLLFLSQQPQKQATREQILFRIWGYGANIETRTLETHVYQLRKKIEPQPEKPRILISIPGGYALRKDDD